MSFAMTTPEDVGIPSDLLAQAEATARDVRPFLPLLDSMRPVMQIIERQHTAMEEMRRSFEEAMRQQPPPQTRQALADMVHQLRQQSLLAAMPVISVHDPEQAVLALRPQTPEEVDQVKQDIAAIEKTPDLEGKLRRLVGGIDRADIGELTAWGALIWVTQRLLAVADSPISQQMSTDQIAALQNRLQVLAIIAALASIILTMRGRR
jgi:hypothetical protein